MRATLVKLECLLLLFVTHAYVGSGGEPAVKHVDAGRVLEEHLHVNSTCNLVCPESTRCSQNACRHKALLPLDTRDKLSLISVFVATALAAGGGIGGGGLLVPIYLLVNNWEPSRASALSLATISGGSVANLITYMQRYHPTPEPIRPLIDYDASLFFCPALLAGTTLGTMFSVIFPDLLTIFCMVLVLGYSGLRTLRTGLTKWRSDENNATEILPRESSIVSLRRCMHWCTCSRWQRLKEERFPETEEELKLPDTDDAVESPHPHVNGPRGTPHEFRYDLDLGDKTPIVVGHAEDEEGGDDDNLPARRVESDPRVWGHATMSCNFPPIEECGTIVNHGAAEELKSIYQRESKLLPPYKLVLTAAIWIMVLVFSLLRGGKHGASVIGLGCGGPLYWLLFLGNMCALVFFTACLRHKLLGQSEHKRMLGHVAADGDLQWTTQTTLRYPVIAILAGILAGLLGIGGGMVLGPLLVGLGCLPRPVAATSAYVVFITATSGLCQVCIFGTLPYDYAALFASIGLVSTFFGQTMVDFLVRRFKKDAVVILLIGVIMLVALVLMTAAGLRGAYYSSGSHGFKPLCHK